MNARKTGHTQEVSSAKAGVSVRSGRTIEKGRPQPKQGDERHWRTRKDPLEEVWSSELEPMLNASPELTAITLLEYLQAKHPEHYEDSLLRTLQRRVKGWRLAHGPDLEVMFRQTHEPGQLGLSDFTKLKRVSITINGKVLEHLLYHFRLRYSKWSSLKVVLGGESFSALAEGLQDALQRLGGAPLEHRTDSLSAAFKNLSKEAAEDITQRYQTLCAHYQMKASRNNRGCGHENGAVESPHGHLKRRIEQALLLRGHNDFASVADYQAFIDEVVAAHNARNAKALFLERPHLRPLPEVKTLDYTQVQAVVTCSSTIDVRRVTYTVPSQLQGQTLQIRLYDDRLACYLGHQLMITLPRIHPISTTRARLVNYRHVIHSLVKKPQAFRYSRLRDDLLPNNQYHMIWRHVDKTMQAKAACRFIVGLLHLAATQDCETQLAETVLDKMARQRPLVLSSLQTAFEPERTTLPDVNVVQHDLTQYDDLINQQENCHE